MKNRRFRFIGSEEDANEYESPRPVRRKIYYGHDSIGNSTAGVYATTDIGTIKDEWQEVVDEQTTDIGQLRFEVEHAIRTTLVVINKQNIRLAVDKIMKLL